MDLLRIRRGKALLALSHLKTVVTADPKFGVPIGHLQTMINALLMIKTRVKYKVISIMVYYIVTCKSKASCPSSPRGAIICDTAKTMAVIIVSEKTDSRTVSCP